MPIIRSNLNQSQSDSTIAPNGFALVTYTDQNPANLSVNVYKYVVVDSVTGQNIIPPTVIPNTISGFSSPKVFLVGNFFIIVFIATGPSLHYFSVSIFNPFNATAPQSLGNIGTSTVSLPFDGIVLDNILYLAWNDNGATNIKMVFITASLNVSSAVVVDNAA